MIMASNYFLNLKNLINSLELIAKYEIGATDRR